MHNPVGRVRRGHLRRVWDPCWVLHRLRQQVARKRHGRRCPGRAAGRVHLWRRWQRQRHTRECTHQSRMPRQNPNRCASYRCTNCKVDPAPVTGLPIYNNMSMDFCHDEPHLPLCPPEARAGSATAMDSLNWWKDTHGNSRATEVATAGQSWFTVPCPCTLACPGAHAHAQPDAGTRKCKRQFQFLMNSDEPKCPVWNRVGMRTRACVCECLCACAAMHHPRPFSWRPTSCCGQVA